MSLCGEHSFEDMRCSYDAFESSCPVVPRLQKPQEGGSRCDLHLQTSSLYLRSSNYEHDEHDHIDTLQHEVDQIEDHSDQHASMVVPTCGIIKTNESCKRRQAMREKKKL